MYVDRKGNAGFLCAHLTLARRAHAVSSPPSLCDHDLLTQAAMLRDAGDSESMNNRTHINTQLKALTFISAEPNTD